MRRKQRGFWNFVIPAIATVAGALLSKKSQDNAAQQQAQAQEDANRINAETQLEMNRANIEAQREFAQHGVSWKVADSKAAGLHPLFGAGLTGSTFSPSFQAADYRPVPTRAPSDFSWLGKVGQLLGNYLGGSEESKRAQSDFAQGDPSQRVTITEYPDGTRTMVRPILGLESQVSGRPLDPPLELVSPAAQGPLRNDPRYVDESSWFAPGAAFQRWKWGSSGFDVLLPKTTDVQEVFEDKPLWFYGMIVQKNVQAFGPQWVDRALHEFPSSSTIAKVMKAAVSSAYASGVDLGSMGYEAAANWLSSKIKEADAWARRKAGVQ